MIQARDKEISYLDKEKIRLIKGEYNIEFRISGIILIQLDLSKLKDRRTPHAKLSIHKE